MLEIKIDLIPFGDDDDAYTIERFYIVNEAHLGGSMRRYGVYFDDPRDVSGKERIRVAPRVAIVDHDRSKSAMLLVKLALEKLV